MSIKLEHPNKCYINFHVSLIVFISHFYVKNTKHIQVIYGMEIDGVLEDRAVCSLQNHMVPTDE